MFQLILGGNVKSNIEKNHDMDLHKNKRTDSEPRISLNDLLQRAKEKKKEDNKFNLLVISGAVSITLLVIVILTL